MVWAEMVPTHSQSCQMSEAKTSSKCLPQSGSSTMNTPLKYIKTLRWEALNMVKMGNQAL